MEEKLENQTEKIDNIGTRIDRIESNAKKQEKNNQKEFANIRNEIKSNYDSLQKNVTKNIKEDLVPKIEGLEIKMKTLSVVFSWPVTRPKHYRLNPYLTQTIDQII